MGLEHTRDDVATAAKGYIDPRSYVSYDGHEYLEGKDVGVRREEIWKRDGRRCVRCGEMVSLKTMELDHKQGGLGPQRCWCHHNLQTMCKNGCHLGSVNSKHNR